MSIAEGWVLIQRITSRRKKQLPQLNQMRQNYYSMSESYILIGAKHGGSYLYCQHLGRDRAEESLWVQAQSVIYIMSSGQPGIHRKNCLNNPPPPYERISINWYNLAVEFLKDTVLKEEWIQSCYFRIILFTLGK